MKSERLLNDVHKFSSPYGEYYAIIPQVPDHFIFDSFFVEACKGNGIKVSMYDHTLLFESAHPQIPWDAFQAKWKMLIIKNILETLF
ncbi:MAG: hypothetical protein CR972_01525 [Candidatus Moraniibacteriota bacterium]|nr:MAG: hypothetical protein CR972_01525 [Candidatus Moranbacteria bacterium]